VGLTVVPLGLFSSILLLVFNLNDLPLAWIHQFLLGGLTSLVDILANIPGAELYVASPALLAMVVYYVCLLSAGLGVTPVFRTINAAVVTALIVWWIWSPSQILDRQTLRATFLDVGQGDATLLEFPDGQVALIDGGAAYERWDMGRMVVGPYLWEQGIRTIDHLIATHPQLDHVGGLAWVIKHFHVRHYWTNGVQRAKPFYRRLHQAAREEDLNAQIAWAGQDLLQGKTCRMHSLNPPSSPTGASQPLHGLKSGEQLNNLSVVLSVSCGPHSILLPADAEVEALERMTHDPAVQAATLVKIPHHGAKSSFSAGWINQLTAQVAVVSAGQRNRYGHPIPTVLKEYEKNGIEVYRTDRDGAILISQNVDSMETTIQTTRDQFLSVVNKEGNILQQEIRNLRRLGRKWG